MKESKAMRLRALIEAIADFLEDEEALEGVELFRAWEAGAAFESGQRVRYEGILYRCLQSHQAQEDWTPTAAPSLWAKVLIPDENTIPEWVQPDSTNPYQIGDTVRHNGKVWECIVANNTWEPGSYGWEEVS